MNDLGLKGQVAVITGAARGLGRSHALHLASRGVAVVVNDAGVASDGTSPSSRPALEVVEEIREAGGSASASFESVTTPEGAARIVEQAIEQFGRLDILVNNAGFLRDRTLVKMTPADLRDVIDVHLMGSAWMSRAAWPMLRDSSGGRIVHTTSSAGLFGSFGQANYAAAKAGIVGLSRTLALEGAPCGIASNVVAPVARTRMTEGLTAGTSAALDADWISPVVAFLASPGCQLTGEVLTTAGGHIARVFTGLTPGWQAPIDVSLTAEDVATQLDAILATRGFSVPKSAAEEVLPHLQRRAR